MRTILAKLNCLPKLVEGKVIIINDDNTYSAYKPSQYCTIADDFDPINYCLLKTSRYECIVHSDAKDKERYLVNKQIRDMYTRKYPSIRVGDRIHIHSRQGIYTVEEIRKSSIVITCKVWQHSDHKYVEVDFADFKCLAGGLHNAVFE